ncbi:hypothetical protein MKZ38_002413 [Zalerion maritima]|uniref:Uncharacterized protein n=1 Tax=Zalerion maritima TaxID=339359 RepID=A0AAD5WSG3_9PEZI|nr:hypothetical protein MKZ38_002413 [Zalerion maritima]
MKTQQRQPPFARILFESIQLMLVAPVIFKARGSDNHRHDNVRVAVQSFSPQTPRLVPGDFLTETQLQGHDFAQSMGRGLFYRVLLLSPHDVKEPDQLRPRLERLNLLEGGQDVGVAFLLGEGGDVSGMMELQNLLYTIGLSIQIIPIASLEGFVDAMEAFEAGAKDASYWDKHRRPPHHLRDLIPYCTTGDNLTPHTANVLSDVCHSFRDLVGRQRSQRSMMHLSNHLGRKEGPAAIEFWRKEC